MAHTGKQMVGAACQSKTSRGAAAGGTPANLGREAFVSYRRDALEPSAGGPGHEVAEASQSWAQGPA